MVQPRTQQQVASLQQIWSYLPAGFIDLPSCLSEMHFTPSCLIRDNLFHVCQPYIPTLFIVNLSVLALLLSSSIQGSTACTLNQTSNTSFIIEFRDGTMTSMMCPVLQGVLYENLADEFDCADLTRGISITVTPFDRQLDGPSK